MTGVRRIVRLQSARLDLLEAVEITLHVSPFGTEVGSMAAVVELLPQHQRQKRAEHVAVMAASEEW